MNAKRLFLFLAFFVVIGIVITARSGGPAAVLGQGYTGAPGEATCTSCHFGGSYGTVTPNIEIFQVGTTTPVTAYTPGTQYDMRVTVNNTVGSPARYGFQLTALRLTGDQPVAGYSDLGTDIHTSTAGGRTYVEHSSPNPSNQFTFRWTAPGAGSGSVRFYAAGNCVNNNGDLDGDVAGSAFITVTEAVPLSVTGTQADVTCFGLNNGSINITASGGTPGYSYLWSDGATSEDRTGLAPGNYSVTVTDNASATATSPTFVITQPAAPLGITLNVGGIACAGGLASVSVGATGGTPPYTGIGTFSLAPGQHTVTVTDNKGCIKDTTFTVGPAPAPISVDVVANGLLPCDGNGTTVTVTASGGTGTLTGTGTFNVTTAGNHTYTVTDANSCTGQGSVTVNTVSGITVSTDVVQPGCSDTCAGILSSTVQTSSFPVTEVLTTVPGGLIITNDSTLCPGDYVYEVTDNAGCEFTFSFTIETPAYPGVTVTQITPANGGNNGGIDITVTGGETPYTFDWSNGSSDEDLTGVGAGTYSVTVTGSNDCEETVSGIEIFDIAHIEEAVGLGLSVYPNPFRGSFQLSDPLWQVISVKDMSGKRIAYRQTGHTVTIDNPAPGIYLVQVGKDDKVAIIRLVSQ